MYLHVRVEPNAKRERLQKLDSDHLEIWVKEPAENNRANSRVKELVALHYGISVKKVRIVNGHHSGSKLFAIAE